MRRCVNVAPGVLQRAHTALSLVTLSAMASTAAISWNGSPRKSVSSPATMTSARSASAAMMGASASSKNWASSMAIMRWPPLRLHLISRRLEISWAGKRVPARDFRKPSPVWTLLPWVYTSMSMPVCFQRDKIRMSSSDLPEYMQPAMTCRPVYTGWPTPPGPGTALNMAVCIFRSPRPASGTPPALFPAVRSPTPGRVHRERILVVLIGPVAPQLRQLPLVAQRRKKRVAFHHRVHLGDVNDVRVGQQRLVQLLAADDEQLPVRGRPGQRQRLLRRVDHLHALGPEAAVPGHHHVAAARQRPPQRLEGFAAHDHGVAHGRFPEKPHVVPQPPRDAAAPADDAVFAAGDDHVHPAPRGRSPALLGRWLRGAVAAGPLPA